MAGRQLASYTRKYGKIEGTKMFKREQKMSGLRSQHEQQKKRLRKGRTS